jgi:glycosyltransferase involved in cell wall biosynthesis
VLFVTHNVPRFVGDAAGSFVLRLAVALQADGARVDIIAPGAPGLASRDVIEGVRIARVRYASEQRMTLAYTGTMAEAVQSSWSGRFALAGLLLQTRRAAQRALSAARREGAPYDIVHVHWWFPSGLALHRALGRGAPPLVLTMHGSDVRLAERTPAAHAMMRAVLRGSASCTAVSSWLADRAHTIAPLTDIVVAPMPVDDRLFTERDAAARETVGDAAPARRGVLFVGRLNAQKGLADLLEAMADSRLAAATLHVVGNGPDRAALVARTTALGLADRVHWHDVLSQQELAPYYRDAACVVIPSRQEGLGLVAVEAQLCGTPVIAYADGGLLDVVRTDHGGTLVTPGDTRALAAAIDRLLADPVRQRKAGRDAQAFMVERFTPQAVATRYRELYDRARATSPEGASR